MTEQPMMIVLSVTILVTGLFCTLQAVRWRRRDPAIQIVWSLMAVQNLAFGLAVLSL